MQTYDLFPTLVGADEYPDWEIFKQKFFDNLVHYTRADGLTGEASGFIDLHLNEDFQDFFKYVADVAKKYVNTIVSEDVWELWLVKTWYSDFPVPLHDHADSHLSFVYYVNVPENCDQTLQFINPKTNLNDLTRGMFLGEQNKNVEFDRNQYNCTAIEFPLKEGYLIVFPSRLQHVVKTSNDVHIKQDASKSRISIAGDFVLTFKEPMPRGMGLQPINNWRKF